MEEKKWQWGVRASRGGEQMGGGKLKKNKRRDREIEKEGRRKNIEGIYRREGEGSNIIPSLGAAAPRRRGAGAEKGKGCSVATRGWWTMLQGEESGPLAHGHDSRGERGRVGEGERESGRREKLQRKTLARRGDLREAQRKTKAFEGTLAR